MLRKKVSSTEKEEELFLYFLQLFPTTIIIRPSHYKEANLFKGRYRVFFSRKIKK
jgi:hypothetical protein